MDTKLSTERKDESSEEEEDDSDYPLPIRRRSFSTPDVPSSSLRTSLNSSKQSIGQEVSFSFKKVVTRGDIPLERYGHVRMLAPS